MAALPVGKPVAHIIGGVRGGVAVVARKTNGGEIRWKARVTVRGARQEDTLHGVSNLADAIRETMRLAREWRDDAARGVATRAAKRRGAPCVGDLIDAYLTFRSTKPRGNGALSVREGRDTALHLRRLLGSTDNRFVGTKTVREKLLGDLTEADVRTWLLATPTTLSAESARRMTNDLMAMLRHEPFRHMMPAGWSDTLERARSALGLRSGRFRSTDARQEDRFVISDELLREIIAEAERVVSVEFGLYVRVVAATGARPIQIERTRRFAVADVVRIDGDWKTGVGCVQRRPVDYPITPALAERIRDHHAAWPDAQHMLVTEYGRPWNEMQRKRNWSMLARHMSLPAGCTLYRLRDRRIIAMLLNGVSVVEVARMHFTSVGEIETRYAREVAAAARAAGRVYPADSVA